MTSVDYLTYKGNPVENLTYKNQEVNILNVRGYSWEKVSPGPEPPTPSSFVIRPILYDSEIGTSYADAYGVPTGETISVTGNSTFVGLAPSGTNLQQVEIAGDTSVVSVLPIDNWGYIFNRYYSYNEWAGGIAGTEFSIIQNYTYNDAACSLKFQSTLDENNTTLLEGCYLNKVIRIPVSGGRGELKLDIYPYSFRSYTTELSLQWWDYENGVFYTYSSSDAKFKNNQSEIPLRETQFNSLQIEKIDGVTAKIIYQFKNNYNTRYHHYPIIFNGTIINFVQESLVNNENSRVYFGKPYTYCYTDKKYQYWDFGTQQMVYPFDYSALIHNLGSWIFFDNFQLPWKSDDWILIMPAYIFNVCNVYKCTSSGDEIQLTTADASTSFNWGNRTHYYFSNIKFINVIKIRIRIK